MEVILDAGRLADREAAQTYLQEKFGFPDYYGRNLDALYDCLTEFEELEVTFWEDVPEAGEGVGAEETLGAEAGPLMSGYAARVYRVFLAAARENPGLKIRRIAG